MFSDNVSNEKINYIPHYISMAANYNTEMTINSAFKQIIYKPDLFTGDSARFILNSNGCL